MAKKKNIEKKLTNNNTKKRVPLSRKLFSTLGVPGEILSDAYNDEVFRSDSLTISDYRGMLDNDGQIQMLWNAITNIILSQGVQIEEDTDYKNKEESEELQFVKTNLLSTVHKGGMKTTMDSINRIMLRAWIDGFRCFEVVYRKGENGKIELDKLAPRAGLTEEEFKLLVDDKGEFKGVKQRTTFKGKSIDLKIENDGIVRKIVKATYGAEFNSLYGRSGLKAAWYHYDKAHKGMFLNHVGHELGAVKFRHAKAKIRDDEKIQNFTSNLSRVGLESVLVYPETDFELTIEDLSDASVMEVGRKMISLHYSMIAKTIHAQFIDLGSATSETGSRALGESQIAFFKQGLQALSTILLENTWNEIIADLIKVNFNRGVYPRLIVPPIDDSKAEALNEAFMAMAKSGKLPDSMNQELLVKAGAHVGINVDADTIKKETEEKKKEEEEKAKVFPPKGPIMQTKKAVKLEEIDFEFIRELYPNEIKVKLFDIRRKLDDVETIANMVLRNKMKKSIGDAVEDYVEALQHGVGAIRSVKIKLTEETTYDEELSNLILEIAEYGKIMAANEMGVSVPSTTKAERKSLIDMFATGVILEQTARLTFLLREAANTLIRARVLDTEARTQMWNEGLAFADQVIRPTVSMAVSKSFNAGREITFEKNNDKIYAERYTAILDSSTTNFCRELDGRVFHRTDPDYFLLSPPNHYGCRSIWTIITIDEAEGVAINGRPAGLPAYATVNSFKDIEKNLEGSKVSTGELEHQLDTLVELMDE